MNWLAHFHFLPSDAHALAPIGTVLADLGHDLEPRLRAPAIVEVLGAGDDDGCGIAQGARHHLDADAIFHSHELVTDRFTAVRLKLQAPEFAAIPRRREFVAHVLVELALDAALHARDATLPSRLAAAHDEGRRARARAAFARDLPGRAGGVNEGLAAFAGRIHFLADSSPAALARRLGRTIAYRLKLDPAAVPEPALAALIAETVGEWAAGLPELERALVRV